MSGVLWVEGAGQEGGKGLAGHGCSPGLVAPGDPGTQRPRGGRVPEWGARSRGLALSRVCGDKLSRLFVVHCGEAEAQTCLSDLAGTWVLSRAPGDLGGHSIHLT